jgi:prophage regulatory protein
MEWNQQYGRFCRDCEYWQGISLSSRKSNDFKGVKGECHRFPPFNVSNENNQWTKPVTLDLDGCGEFKLVSHMHKDANEQDNQSRKDTQTETIESNNDCLINAKGVAKILNVGVSHIYMMRSCGLIPLPIKLGGSVRWNKLEIIDWINTGCPSLNKWMRLRDYKK